LTIGRSRFRQAFLLLFPLGLLACESQKGPQPAPPNTISFAVFGDAPYSRFEDPLFETLLKDVGEVRPDFFLHVGDILGSSCTDERCLDRRSALEMLPVPVVYTPGDNEWTDCRGEGIDPLERLASLRRIFFTGPWADENRRRLGMVSQDAADGLPYPENVRFRIGSVVFATAHIVGSGNGTRPFPGRGEQHDREVEERTQAAFAWIRSAFAEARQIDAPLLVLAFHGDPDFEGRFEDWPGFRELMALLATQANDLQGQVLAVHGDSHEYLFDHPLVDPTTGEAVPNFTRLETFGSPEVGWIQVVIDTLAPDLVAVRPYLCAGRWDSLAWFGLKRPPHCVPAGS